MWDLSYILSFTFFSCTNDVFISNFTNLICVFVKITILNIKFLESNILNNIRLLLKYLLAWAPDVIIINITKLIIVSNKNNEL